MAKAKKAKPSPRNKKLYDEGMKMRTATAGIRRQVVFSSLPRC